jgi:hypothetical protein
MKAIYRGNIVCLVPETINEVNQLAVEFQTGIHQMNPALVQGENLQCFEIHVAEKPEEQESNGAV